MKNRVLYHSFIIISALICLSGLQNSAFAYDTPTQGSANATDTILWYGDNLTIASANVTGTVTIADLQTALTAASQAGGQVMVTQIASVWTDLYLFLLVVAIVALAFWQKHPFLYLLAVVATLNYGLTLAAGATVATTAWVLGVTIAVLGFYFLYSVVVSELLPRVRRK